VAQKCIEGVAELLHECYQAEVEQGLVAQAGAGTCVCVCMYLHVYACMYVFMYVSV
jgi:hypothetical protein